MFVGRADLDLAGQLVAFVGIGRDLVSKVGLAMFSRPACVEVLVAPLGRFPVRRHRAPVDDGLFVPARRLLRRLDGKQPGFHHGRSSRLALRNHAMAGRVFRGAQ